MKIEFDEREVALLLDMCDLASDYTDWFAGEHSNETFHAVFKKIENLKRKYGEVADG